MWNMQLSLVVLVLLVNDGRTLWTSSNGSGPQLLGMFQDSFDSSFRSEASIQCRAMFKAAVSLARTFNISIDGQSIGWQVADADDEVITALGRSCSALSTPTLVGIVTPGLSREAHFISRLARRIGVPVVAYAASDHPNSYHTSPSGKSTALAIVKLFQRHNWTSCILIYQNDAFGSSGATVLSEAFELNGLVIRDSIVFDMTKRANLSDRLLNSATRVVVVWAESTLTSTIVREAANNNVLGPRFIWILTTSVSFDNFTLPMRQASIGMLSVEPVSADVVGAPFNVSLLNAAYEMWKRYEPESFPEDKIVSPSALFAFDATWLLIQSLQQLCPPTIENPSHPCPPFRNSSSCFDHEQSMNSTSLLEQMSMTKFLGVSGPIEYRTNGADRVEGIHYVVRNAQPSAEGVKFVKVLKYSAPGEWETFHPIQKVLWPGESFTVPRDRANISGVKLRIGIMESIPFTMTRFFIDDRGRNKSRFVGYIPDLIELLQKRMGFTPELVLVSKNQSYTGIVKRVANGEYDIVVGDVTATSKRRELAVFSTSIYDYSLRLIMRKPTVDHIDLFAYLKPFSLSLWLLILVATICTSILVCLVERRDNDALRDRSTVSMGAMSVWYSLGNIMGYGADFQVTTIAGRLLTVALYILSLVLVASYTANLASNLTISETKFTINGIEDLRQGKIPHNRIGVRVGMITEEFFLRQISAGIRTFYPLYSRAEHFERLLSRDIDAAVMEGGIAEYLTNNEYCALSMVGPSFDVGTYGIVYPKHCLYAEDFDVNLLALRDSGELANIRRRWFESKTCEEIVEASNVMGVESMVGLFLTVGIIAVIALLAVAWTRRNVIKDRLQLLRGQQYSLRRDPNGIASSST